MSLFKTQTVDLISESMFFRDWSWPSFTVFSTARSDCTHFLTHFSWISAVSFFSPPPLAWSKVQSELHRMWQSLSLKRYVGQDCKVHSMTGGRNSTETCAQFPRNFRAQSILQTETSMLWDAFSARVLLNTAETAALGCFMVISLILWWSLFCFIDPSL